MHRFLHAMTRAAQTPLRFQDGCGALYFLEPTPEPSFRSRLLWRVNDCRARRLFLPLRIQAKSQSLTGLNTTSRSSYFMNDTCFVWNLRRGLEFLLRRFVQGAVDVTNERVESQHDTSVDGLLLARAVVMMAISIFLGSLYALATELGSFHPALFRLTGTQNQPLADIRAQARSQSLMEEAAPGVQALMRTPAKGAIAPPQ
jgi:hypothetical protein